jgi:glycosyltransferase involved in cell wall biosynthesis
VKILFLSDNFPPEANAPATRTFEHCREWVRLGARVTVITGQPNFPKGQVYPGYSNRPYQRELVDGIEVVRVWTYMAENSGFGRRILDYLTFAASSLIAGAFVEADVIVGTSPQFFTAVSAFGLSKGKRTPWVFELRDLWPDSIKAVSAMQQSHVLGTLERLELFLYRHADLVVAVSPAFARNLRQRGVTDTRIETVTNGVDLEMFAPRSADRELGVALGLNGKFVVGYIGTHGLAHNIEGLVEAYRSYARQDTALLLIGDGARKRAVTTLVERHRIPGVVVLDPVPKDDIARYWSLIDVALVPLRKHPTFENVLPSKIFEAAAMGKPILLGVDGEARDLVERYDAGVWFEPENGADFLAKLELLRCDRSRYARLSENCRRLAADFDRRSLAVRMYRLLEEVVERRRAASVQLSA